ncbi:MAG: GC-type dockerin domain-anchored protein, partial [Phycisphaerales bacterium]
ECEADFTGDGILDFFDVSAFLAAYNSMDSSADFNDDGIFNFFDVSAFLNAFNAGCP